METPKDTFKFQIVSDAFKINQNFDQKIGQVIIIENKDKSIKEKKSCDTHLVLDILLPLVISIIVILIPKLIYRKREKDEREKIKADIIKLGVEKLKLDEEINQLKRDFQPYVLATLQKTQETILNDKINALREIVKFKTAFQTYNEININEENIEENVDENNEEYNVYMLNIYDKKLFDDFEKIVLLNGYLFPNDIMYSLNSIRNDIGILVSVIDSNLNNNETTNEQILINNLSSKFDNVIEEIRKDLHLDDKFIHDFIEKYKRI